MGLIDTTREFLRTAVEGVIETDITDEKFKGTVSDAVSINEQLLELDPNDLEGNFYKVYLKAYDLMEVANNQVKALDILSDAADSYLTGITKASISESEKQKLLADFSINMAKLSSNFIQHFQGVENLTILIGALALNKNPNVSSSDSFDIFKSTLDNMSDGMMQRGLVFASKTLSAVDKTELDNKYACAAHIAKSAVADCVNAPQFAYDSEHGEFNKKYLPLLESFIGVVKTSDPHTVYSIPTPNYDIIRSEDLKLKVNRDYGRSPLCRLISESNLKAKEEAINRYWETHPGEKDSLNTELSKLEKDQYDSISREHLLTTEISEITSKYQTQIDAEGNIIFQAEREISDLEKQLSKLGLFQGKNKKALRATIDEKKAVLSSKISEIEKKQKQALESIETETYEKKMELASIQQKKSQISSRLSAIKSKLQNPLE